MLRDGWVAAIRERVAKIDLASAPKPRTEAPGAFLASFIKEASASSSRSHPRGAQPTKVVDAEVAPPAKDESGDAKPPVVESPPLVFDAEARTQVRLMRKARRAEDLQSQDAHWCPRHPH